MKINPKQSQFLSMSLVAGIAILACPSVVRASAAAIVCILSSSVHARDDGLVQWGGVMGSDGHGWKGDSRMWQNTSIYVYYYTHPHLSSLNEMTRKENHSRKNRKPKFVDSFCVSCGSATFLWITKIEIKF